MINPNCAIVKAPISVIHWNRYAVRIPRVSPFVFSLSFRLSVCSSRPVIGYALSSVIDCWVLWFSSALWARAVEISSFPSCLVARVQTEPLSTAQSASNSIFLGKLRQGWPCQDQREREAGHSFSAKPKGCFSALLKRQGGSLMPPHAHTSCRVRHRASPLAAVLLDRCCGFEHKIWQ